MMLDLICLELRTEEVLGKALFVTKKQILMYLEWDLCGKDVIQALRGSQLKQKRLPVFHFPESPACTAHTSSESFSPVR